MEAFSTTALLFITFCIGFYCYLTRKHNMFIKMGVAGPRPWPLFGNVLSFRQKGIREVQLANRHRYGRIYGTFRGLSPMLAVTDASMLKEIFIKQFSRFSTRPSNAFLNAPALRGSMFTSGGDHWKHVRSMLSPVLTSGKLKQMHPQIDACVSLLISNLYKVNGQEVSLYDETYAFTLETIASTAFGLAIDVRKDPDDPFIQNAKKFTDFNAKNPLVLLCIALPRLSALLTDVFGFSIISREALNFFQSVLDQSIKERSDMQIKGDFIHQASQRRVNLDTEPAEALRESDSLKWSINGLTQQEILSNALIFFVAGFLTNTRAISHTFHCLALHPAVQERLREEVVGLCADEVPTYEQLQKMEYLDWVIKETLRLYPVASVLERVCMEDTTVGELRIPAGLTVYVPLHSLLMDPDYWEDPECFNPDRFSAENKLDQLSEIWLPFGLGPRSCIGLRLALLEIKSVVARTVQLFDVLPSENTPDSEQGPPLKWAVGLFSDPATPFVARFVAREQPISSQSE